MTPSQTTERRSGQPLEQRYRSSGSVVVDYLRRVSQPIDARQPIYHGYASKNIRRHLWRAMLRMGGLLAADLAGFRLLRFALAALRGAPGPVAEVVAAQVPAGFLGGNHFGAALVISLVVLGNYGPGDHRRDKSRIFLACALAAALPLWAMIWQQPLAALSQYAFITLAMTAVMIADRLSLDLVLSAVLPRPIARVVLVGPGTNCLDMMAREDFADREAMRFVAFVDTARPDRQAVDVLRDIALLLAEHEADTVMMCGQVSEDVFAGVIKTATVAEAQILTTSRLYEATGIQPNIIWRTGQPFIELRAPALRGQQLILKRVLDVAVAGIALVILSPVMAACAIAVKLDSDGPAVFGQRRLGRFGRSFRCFKFRSMYTDAESRLKSDPALYELYVKNDYKLPPELDTRVTPVGAFLRKTSLDELPQLWNVLRGDMSLVGPRPIVPDEIRHYEDEAPLLLLAKPGVTGSWQVNGRSDCVYPERTNVELEYVRNWSLMNDINILLRTVPAVLFQRGAH